VGFPAERGLRLAVAAAAVLVLGGCGKSDTGDEWALPNAELAGTRAVSGRGIDAGNADSLVVRWRLALTGRPNYSGIFASTPVADDTTVYVQDLQSDVRALDRSTGTVRWTRRYHAPNEGPNGLAVDDTRIYGATDSEAFALAKSTGRELWRRHLTSAREQLVDVAPIVWNGLVFTSTVGYSPGGRGAIYALDATSGVVRWKFDTIARPWPHPQESGGGGIWYPASIDEHGRLYAGTSNPTPWGGTPRRPNGGAFPGPVPFTDSLLVLDAQSGRLLWHDQVTPHDVRDYDFEATPILANVDDAPVVFGAGKSGRVIAWDRDTHRRLWATPVGLHRNDVGPLPPQRVTVCPGLLGGVETPMAYAGGRLFVPVVDLCGWGRATASQPLTELEPASGRGRLVALDGSTGRVLWQRRLPSPVFGCATVANDVVFTSTYDGTAYGFAAADGRIVWRARLRAGSNACPAVFGDLVVFGAGIRRPGGPTPELVGYSISGAR
jgi:outer membrane protein assembly factor BamB